MALVVLGEVDHVGADDVELNVAVKDEQNDFVVPARERGPSAYRHPLESSSPDRRAGRQRLYQLDQPAVEPRSTQRETLIEMRPIAPPSIAVPAPGHGKTVGNVSTRSERATGLPPVSATLERCGQTAQR
jgi:hypothetical protein